MRTFQDMMRGSGQFGLSPATQGSRPRPEARALEVIAQEGDKSASLVQEVTGYPPGFSDDQVGTEPLGNLTGAPPPVVFRTFMVTPESALVANGGPTLVVPADRASRLVTFLTPAVGFSVYIGDAGVRGNPGGSGIAIPAGVSYQITIPGNQAIYAITDSPSYLPLRVQVGALLGGDRERVY